MSLKKEEQRPSQSSPLIASIDTGSNTIRLLIGFLKGKTLQRLYSDRRITRLGESITNSGRLNEQRIEDSLDCFRNFRKKAEEFNVRRIAAVGTSALREAENSKYFIERVKNETGIDIRVITPEEEAFLTIEGIRLGLELPKEFIAFDIGGGSTEFVISGNGFTELHSVPAGVLKLSRHIRNFPPSKEIIYRISSDIKNIFSALQSLASGLKPEALIGTGGTVTTLASIDLSLDTYIPERIHGHRLFFPNLKAIFDRLSTLTLKEMSEIRGMEKGREDIILAGLITVMEIMKLFSQESIVVSDFGILEGIIKYETDLMRDEGL
ncbi:MAG: Ppx/GppA family phosphatase [Thermodesulfovibrionales bacterium]|nr:Ppx/GppA family phosphatase [Thermodesulfovibrionales bacterium]